MAWFLLVELVNINFIGGIDMCGVIGVYLKNVEEEDLALIETLFFNRKFVANILQVCLIFEATDQSQPIKLIYPSVNFLPNLIYMMLCMVTAVST